MSGHSKWAQIKRQKATTDAKRSQTFTKVVRLLSVAAKKSGGNMTSPELQNAIIKAKEVNMPADTIERAIKKATADNSTSMEAITYEAYGPGGCAIIIEVLTDSRNRASAGIKHILSNQGIALASIGSAAWAFERKKEGGWEAKTTVPLSETDLEQLEKVVDELEGYDDVQEVYTNVE